MAEKHFHKELDRIKKMILSLGAQVEERFHMAIKAIENKDATIAKWIIDSDHEIDETEVNIEEECLKILALYQPVAVDLRFIIAVIKINNDLERIADEACNIAERLAIILKHKDIDIFFDYSIMWAKTADMLKQSLDSLINLNSGLAKQVIHADDEIDHLDNAAYDEIKAHMHHLPEHMGYWINLMYISRHIERIADHAVNIAEEVLYLIEGEIVRHGEIS
ncbi:MAG: phosphate signaling complex protein PhoU [Desulfobacterales bacterium]|nr:phosphate signaling complex protein PhoU [Desulfobacterales bacterium]MDD4073001.1 phosphate signaling complex protein PhoU [Desulfobacterales bacterium]MDD4394230.1 phosphate signaling complex protein PhoU [Desulfobacterales bacterium]